MSSTNNYPLLEPEEIAIEIYKQTNGESTYDTGLQIYKFEGTFLYDYDCYRKSLEFLYKRHETLRYYFKEVSPGNFERTCDDNFVPTVKELIILDEKLTLEVANRLFEDYPTNFLKAPFLHHFLVANKDGVYILVKGNHAFCDAFSLFMLSKEQLIMYRKLYKRGANLTYEEAIEGLPEVPKFTDYVEEFHKDREQRMAKVHEYLTNLVGRHDLNDKINVYKDGIDYTNTKYKIDLKNSSIESILSKYKVKMPHIFKAILQIAILKVFGVKNLLVSNINGYREKKWQHLAAYQIKIHPFLVPVDEEKTLKEQIIHNDEENKKMLKVFGPLYTLLQDEKDKFNLERFNYNFIFDDEDVSTDLDLVDEIDEDVSLPFNIWFMINYKPKNYLIVSTQTRQTVISEEEHMLFEKTIQNLFERTEELLDTQIKEFI